MPDYPQWERFDLEHRLVREFTHWIIVVRRRQVTLGSCSFLLKRASQSVGDLQPAEAAVSWFESVATRTFGAEKFNYVFVMMRDRDVHFHAMPRYASPKTFAGREWVDTTWPAFSSFPEPETSEEELQAIMSALAAG